MNLKGMKSRLLIILLFLIFAVLVIQLYKGTVNDFAPKQIGPAYILTTDEPAPAYARELMLQAPGFYTFVAMIIEVTNIDIYRLPVFPIMLIPYLVVFFACLYTLSKRSLFALVTSLLLTFVLFTLPLDGTHKVWLWVHGLGEILLFTFIILLTMPPRGQGVPSVIAGLLIVGTTIAISYDNAYYIFVLTCSLLIFARVRRGSLEPSVRSLLLGTLLFFIVGLLGFSRFVYSKFIPTLQSVHLTLHPIQMFIAQFFGYHGNNELLELAMRYPSSLTIINIVKEMIYGVIILAGLIIAIRYFRRKDGARNLLIPLYFSIIVTVISYIVVRLFVGHFALSDVFYIVIFSVPVITYAPAVIRRFNIQKCLIAMLAILLALNLTTLSIAHRNNVVQKDSYHYITVASDWLYENLEGPVYFPDELTFGWSFIKYCELLPQSTQVIPTYLPRDDILNLYYSRNITEEKTIIINYRENYTQGGMWDNLLPFKEFRQTIEANPFIKAEIYTLNDDIIVVQTW
jgi:hypothetical protein